MQPKTVAFLIALVFVGALAWMIFSRLSSDAVSMALGVMFGVLGGVPTAILVIASGRRHEPSRPPQQAQAPQPPVIIIHGGKALPHDVHHHPPVRSYSGALQGLTAPREQLRKTQYR